MGTRVQKRNGAINAIGWRCGNISNETATKTAREGERKGGKVRDIRIYRVEDRSCGTETMIDRVLAGR